MFRPKTNITLGNSPNNKRDGTARIELVQVPSYSLLHQHSLAPSMVAASSTIQHQVSTTSTTTNINSMSSVHNSGRTTPEPGHLLGPRTAGDGAENMEHVKHSESTPTGLSVMLRTPSSSPTTSGVVTGSVERSGSVIDPTKKSHHSNINTSIAAKFSEVGLFATTLYVHNAVSASIQRWDGVV